MEEHVSEMEKELTWNADKPKLFKVNPWIVYMKWCSCTDDGSQKPTHKKIKIGRGRTVTQKEKRK